ncbi:MAG: hypothetical protein IJ461_04165 [Clostridia bacterium]|nr:hypothetical protein [Clostridia bacterium]
MKKTLILVLCFALAAAPALALTLPEIKGGTKQFQDYDYTADYLCDVWVYPGGTPHEGWLLACLEAGFALQKAQVEGYEVYRVTDDAGRYALLFPQYSGAVMLMVQKGMIYGPEAPLPTADPPDPPNGHWETVSVEVDCPACVNGVCDLCQGTGVFRLYGTVSDCERKCQTCGGLGTYASTQRVFVYD